MPDLEWVVNAHKVLGVHGVVIWAMSGLLMVLSGLVFGSLTMAVIRGVAIKPDPVTPTTQQVATQTNSQGNVIQAGAAAPQSVTQTTVTGNQAGGDLHVHVYTPERLSAPADEIQADRVRVKLDSAIGKRADVEVYMLWDKASWQKGEASLTSEKGFQKFLVSDVMAEAFDKAEFIGCVGLASNEMKARLNLATSDEKEAQLGKLTDRRASRLCEYVAEAARDLQSTAKFVGIGIGYNQEPPTNESNAEVRQRASILVRVNRTSGPVLTKDDVRAVIGEIIRKVEIQGFKPNAYSRVREKRPFCWVAIEQGTFDPNELEC